MDECFHHTGIVAIGRNEGRRLEACLRSVPRELPMVYVDSASTDGSANLALSFGVDVVMLDMRKPFTAARARNEGFRRLIEIAPRLRFVQFVDGDCELERNWLAAATAFLIANDSYSVVCGRRRERFPEASFYNQMCDQEWDTPIGDALACGGDALYRVSPLANAGGFDPSMVAGEEPELCQRLRVEGWRVMRLNAPMTIHDAYMHHARQWWLRAIRSGFGYMQAWRKTSSKAGFSIYGREVASAIFWTVGVVVGSLALLIAIGPLGILAAPAVWALQLVRLAHRHGWRKATHLLLGKIAELIGIVRYCSAAIRGRQQGAIFYK